MMQSECCVLLPSYNENTAATKGSPTITSSVIAIAAFVAVVGIGAVCWSNSSPMAAYVQSSPYATHVLPTAPQLQGPQSKVVIKKPAPGQLSSAAHGGWSEQPSRPGDMAQVVPSNAWGMSSLVSFVALPVLMVMYALRRSQMGRHSDVAMAASIGLPDWRGSHFPRHEGPVSPVRPRSMALKAAAGEPGSELTAKPKPVLQPKTSIGEFLQYTLTNYPHLFEVNVQQQIQLLCDARAQQVKESDISQTNLALYRRINEVRRSEEQQALEDILYLSVLKEFCKLGISTIDPQQIQNTASFVQSNADRLLSCVHSDEEKEVVMAHLRKTLGPMVSMEAMFSKATLKVLKIQVFEMFASSLLFGYFLRHTYKRFALARSLGMLPEDPKRNIALLQAIYEKSSTETECPDTAAPIDTPIKPKPMTLKDYIEKMDRKTIMEQSYFKSLESTQMVQDYLKELFGDVKVLMQQLQDVANEPTPVTNPEEYMQRMMEAAEMNKLDVVEISLQNMQRMILEAVAFGTFLKDAESYVEVTADRPLLRSVKRAP